MTTNVRFILFTQNICPVTISQFFNETTSSITQLLIKEKDTTVFNYFRERRYQPCSYERNSVVNHLQKILPCDPLQKAPHLYFRKFHTKTNILPLFVE